jgi:hypothetical protein
MMDEKKQIEEMAVEFAKINCNPKGCYSCNLCDEYGSLELNCEDYLYYRTMAETFYNAGYRKQEWISVKERLPDTTLKRLVICDQDIGSGEVLNEEDGGMVQMSAIVAVISRRCTGGEVKQFFDFDQTIDGVWAHNMSVTHWMPLPEPPKEVE